MKILGIDPGSKAVGFGLLVDGEYADGGTVNVKGKNLQDKLFFIGEELSKILQRTAPDIGFLESTIYYRNVKTALVLGAVRGVILYEFARVNVNVVELSPTRIKESITGNGRAQKEQVAYMLSKLLHISVEGKTDHHTDAIACALAGLRQSKNAL